MIKKRIFIAITISEKVQKEILSWERKYLSSQPVFAKSTAGKIRWLTGKNLHITLIPPWYKSDIKNQISKIKNIQSQPFEIKFTKVTYGPDPKRPRLIWAEGDAPKELIQLKDKLERVLQKEPEKRPYKLHLTIARFRPETFLSFSIKEISEDVVWQDEVNSFVLMGSHLSREGADYEIIETFDLT